MNCLKFWLDAYWSSIMYIIRPVPVAVTHHIWTATMSKIYFSCILLIEMGLSYLVWGKKNPPWNSSDIYYWGCIISTELCHMLSSPLDLIFQVLFWKWLGKWREGRVKAMYLHFFRIVHIGHIFIVLWNALVQFHCIIDSETNLDGKRVLLLDIIYIF